MTNLLKSLDISGFFSSNYQNQSSIVNLGNYFLPPINIKSYVFNFLINDDYLRLKSLTKKEKETNEKFYKTLNEKENKINSFRIMEDLEIQIEKMTTTKDRKNIFLISNPKFNDSLEYIDTFKNYLQTKTSSREITHNY